jgi:hypothetical protein
VCPDPSTLKTLDEILSVQANGCAVQARVALETYIAGQGKP